MGLMLILSILTVAMILGLSLSFGYVPMAHAQYGQADLEPVLQAMTNPAGTQEKIDAAISAGLAPDAAEMLYSTSAVNMSEITFEPVIVVVSPDTGAVEQQEPVPEPSEPDTTINNYITIEDPSTGMQMDPNFGIAIVGTVVALAFFAYQSMVTRGQAAMTGR